MPIQNDITQLEQQVRESQAAYARSLRGGDERSVAHYQQQTRVLIDRLNALRDSERRTALSRSWDKEQPT